MMRVKVVESVSVGVSRVSVWLSALFGNCLFMLVAQSDEKMTVVV